MKPHLVRASFQYGKLFLYYSDGSVDIQVVF
jgi:hypothetical protein